MTNYLLSPFQLSRYTSFLSWGGESSDSIDFFISKYFLRTNLVFLRPIVNILIKKIKTSSEGKCLLISWWCCLGDVCLFIAAGICASYVGSSCVPPTAGGQLGSCAALCAMKCSLKCSPVSAASCIPSSEQCQYMVCSVGVHARTSIGWSCILFPSSVMFICICWFCWTWCQTACMEVVMRLMGDIKRNIEKF